MSKWAKVDSIYTNDDPYLPDIRRRWKWNRCLPLVLLILAVWCAVWYWGVIQWAGR